MHICTRQFLLNSKQKTLPKLKEDPIINEPANDEVKTGSKEDPKAGSNEDLKAASNEDHKVASNEDPKAGSNEDGIIDAIEKRVDIVDSSEEVTSQDQPETVQAPVR